MKLTQQIIATCFIALLVPQVAQALLITDLDLSSLSFEVDGPLPSDPTAATGTSNGIGFTLTMMSPHTFYAAFSNTTNVQGYNDLPGSYDDLHLGHSFTISFATPIEALLVALANDNATGAGPDFGLTPVDSTGITVTGTQLAINDIGGSLVLFEFATPVTSLSHTEWLVNGQPPLDGWDTSFFAYAAESAVPVPATIALFGLGLLLLGWRRRG